jgi:hypothetical protein
MVGIYETSIYQYHIAFMIWMQAFAALYRGLCAIGSTYIDLDKRVAESLNLV